MAKNSGSSGDDYNDPRRDFLVRMLTAGAFVGGVGWNFEALASWFGSVPSKLPAGKSVFDMKGQVLIDDQPARHDTIITPLSKITTGPNSYLVAGVGDGAFIVRESSQLHLGGDGVKLLVRGMQLVTGAMLTVFGHRATEDMAAIKTPTATIGIRGTGFYTEADPEKTYFCTCYGLTQIASSVDQNESTQVAATHHNAPKYILADPDSGKRIIPAPFKNHTDLELMTIEALCGRKVPFAIPGDQYEGPRKDY
jgi:hypothetical protein